MTVHVQVHVRQTYKALKGIQKDQFPWSLAISLTKTAKKAQERVRMRTRRVFHLHTEYIPRGIMVEYAKKKEVVQFGTTEAAVFTSRGITPFMAWHETGGTKRPRGQVLTIPGPNLTKYAYRTSTGKTRKTWQPKNLLSKPSPKKAGRKKGRLTRYPFIIPKHGTQPALLVRRVRKGDRGLEVLYVFRPQAVIKRRWGFEKVVNRVAQRWYTKIFAKEWQKALAKAH